MNLGENFSRPNRLTRWDIVWTLVPSLIWGTVTWSRPYLLETPCQNQPENCSAQELPWVDRIVVPMNHEEANRWSTWTQNTAGVVAVAIPTLFHSLTLVGGTVSPGLALTHLLKDGTILLQTALWNGAVMESFRVFTQRPRPFVYRDPIALGGQPSHYTSFYSGHTSFAASIGLASLLLLLSYQASLVWIVVSSALGITLTFLTGFFRVWAGKHFVTDVAIAVVAGFIVSFVIAHFHKREGRENTQASGRSSPS